MSSIRGFLFTDKRKKLWCVPVNAIKTINGKSVGDNLKEELKETEGEILLNSGKKLDVRPLTPNEPFAKTPQGWENYLSLGLK